MGAYVRYRYVGAYGCRWDADTGLVYARARWYAPELQRWLSRDIVQGSNRYAYADNKPTSLIDPSGENPLVLPLAWLIGFYFGARAGARHARMQYNRWDQDIATAVNSASALNMDPGDIRTILDYYRRIYPRVANYHCPSGQSELYDQLIKAFAYKKNISFQRVYFGGSPGSTTANPDNVVEVTISNPLQRTNYHLLLYPGTLGPPPIIVTPYQPLPVETDVTYPEYRPAWVK